MSKKAIVILAEGFEETEAVTCMDMLRRAGIALTVASLNGATVKGAHDIEIKADIRLADAGDDFDACILPGGMPGAKNLGESSLVKNLLISFNKKGKIIAAICASPAVVLAPIGILNGKAATCYPGMQTSFKGRAAYQEKSTVTDGCIITSRGPATALDFSVTIVEKVLGKETADKLKRAVLLSP